MKVWVVYYDDGSIFWVQDVYANKEDAQKSIDGTFYEVKEMEVRGLP